MLTAPRPLQPVPNRRAASPLATWQVALILVLGSRCMGGDAVGLRTILGCGDRAATRRRHRVRRGRCAAGAARRRAPPAGSRRAPSCLLNPPKVRLRRRRAIKVDVFAGEVTSVEDRSKHAGCDRSAVGGEGQPAEIDRGSTASQVEVEPPACANRAVGRRRRRCALAAGRSRCHARGSVSGSDDRRRRDRHGDGPAARDASPRRRRVVLDRSAAATSGTARAEYALAYDEASAPRRSSSSAPPLDVGGVVIDRTRRRRRINEAEQHAGLLAR